MGTDPVERSDWIRRSDMADLGPGLRWAIVVLALVLGALAGLLVWFLGAGTGHSLG